MTKKSKLSISLDYQSKGLSRLFSLYTKSKAIGGIQLLLSHKKTKIWTFTFPFFCTCSNLITPPLHPSSCELSKVYINPLRHHHYHLYLTAPINATQKYAPDIIVPSVPMNTNDVCYESLDWVNYTKGLHSLLSFSGL